MILTLTPNPAFDRIQTVPGFGCGQVCRATAVALSAGGKGVNVARAVRGLGGNAMCCGFLGGHTGRMFSEHLSNEGIPANWTWIDGETRVSPVIISPETGETTVINEAGPIVTPQDWERLSADVLTAASKSRMVCISGTLPPGLPPDLLARLIASLKRLPIPVFVDSSGVTLQAAVTACPDTIKINGTEAAALLGWNECQDAATAVRAAQAIRARGIGRVVLTLGKDGAILASGQGTWVATPPSLKAVCTIGSGDAFLAGLALSVAQGIPEAEALRRAVAAGSANALSVRGGAFPREDYDKVLASVTVREITSSPGGSRP